MGSRLIIVGLHLHSRHRGNDGAALCCAGWFEGGEDVGLVAKEGKREVVVLLRRSVSRVRRGNIFTVACLNAI